MYTSTRCRGETASQAGQDRSKHTRTGETTVTTNHPSQRASVQQQHALHVSRRTSEDRNRCLQLHPRQRRHVQHINRSYFIQRSRTFPNPALSTKKGREPAMPPQPYLIQRPRNLPLQFKVNPQKPPTRFRQPSIKPSESLSIPRGDSHENIIQSDPVRLCRYRDLLYQRPSRRRYYLYHGRRSLTI